MLRLAHRLLQPYPDVMVLADRGFANHDLLAWLSQSRWHYCLRLPSDVGLHDPRRHPIEVGYLWPLAHRKTEQHAKSADFSVGEEEIVLFQEARESHRCDLDIHS